MEVKLEEAVMTCNVLAPASRLLSLFSQVDLSPQS